MIDPRIELALLNESIRQRTTIELIASENYTSQAVMDLCGSILTNKYAEGLPGKRYYNGCTNVDDIENIAIEYATKLFGREYADLLETKGITVNKNGVPGETRSFAETSGVRIGVAAETTRGHNEQWFRDLAMRMIGILRG